MNTNDKIETRESQKPDLKSKSKLLTFVLGIFIGLAVIIPGVSGSTIAIIFSLYTAMLYALGNVFNDFKRCIVFLIPLGLGAVVGFGAGFIGVVGTLLLCIPINAIIHAASGIDNVSAQMPLAAGVILVIISVVLTLISGLFPSRVASKKDPVEALRSE